MFGYVKWESLHKRGVVEDSKLQMLPLKLTFSKVMNIRHNCRCLRNTEIGVKCMKWKWTRTTKQRITACHWTCWALAIFAKETNFPTSTLEDLVKIRGRFVCDEQSDTQRIETSYETLWKLSDGVIWLSYGVICILNGFVEQTGSWNHWLIFECAHWLIYGQWHYKLRRNTLHVKKKVARHFPRTNNTKRMWRW